MDAWTLKKALDVAERARKRWNAFLVDLDSLKENNVVMDDGKEIVILSMFKDEMNFGKTFIMVRRGNGTNFNVIHFMRFFSDVLASSRFQSMIGRLDKEGFDDVTSPLYTGKVSFGELRLIRNMMPSVIRDGGKIDPKDVTLPMCWGKWDGKSNTCTGCKYQKNCRETQSNVEPEPSVLVEVQKKTDETGTTSHARIVTHGKPFRVVCVDASDRDLKVGEEYEARAHPKYPDMVLVKVNGDELEFFCSRFEMVVKL